MELSDALNAAKAKIVQQVLPSVLAVCLLAVVLANIAIAAAFTPLPRRCLELPPSKEGNPRNSEGAFVTLKDGRIMFIYTHFNGQHGGDHGAAVLAARYSSDQGETWTETDRIIVENEGMQNVMSVSLLRLANGRIALIYLRRNSLFDCRPVLRFSVDEGESWSAPIDCIPDEVGYYVLHNDRVIQLTNGRLVMPLSRHAGQGDKQWDRKGTLCCYLSDDNGLTWHRSKEEWQVFDDVGKRITAQEPGVVELKDGRIMMFIRSDCGSQMLSFSNDFGETWTKSQPSAILSPLSPASIKRLPQTGDLLLVWNNHQSIPPPLSKRRVPFSLAVSKDDGQTWTLIKTLEGNSHNGHYCYTAIHFTDDAILLGYSALNGVTHARIAKVPVSWLYRNVPTPPVEWSPAVFPSVPNDTFTILETSLGTWTAAAGHAEVFAYPCGKGIRLKGGAETAVKLQLTKPRKLADVHLAVERFASLLAARRFASLSLYTFTVEAFVNDRWVRVFTQDGSKTAAGRHYPVRWVHPSLITSQLRFRCTSSQGAIIGNMRIVDFNAFFED